MLHFFKSAGNFTFVVNCRTKNLIRNAILKNKFLGDLDESRIENLVSVMYCKHVKANTRIIHQDETGE